jgi:hypothetical protein
MPWPWCAKKEPDAARLGHLNVALLQLRHHALRRVVHGEILRRDADDTIISEAEIAERGIARIWLRILHRTPDHAFDLRAGKQGARVDRLCPHRGLRRWRCRYVDSRRFGPGIRTGCGCR